jgi:O-antigen/teichoic acid export membrane protein
VTNDADEPLASMIGANLATSAGAAAEASPHAHDVTGRDRLAWNVMCSWAGHVVFILSGFIMPRLIDQQLGQATLGVWDFCWSLVSYFELAQIGVGASINRHVAMYRASGDVAALRRTVSSAVAVQWAAALIALTLTAAGVFALSWFPAIDGEHLTAGRWVLGLLGLSVAVELSFNSYRGVVSGCHRWDLQNAITGGMQLAVLPAMATALHRGGGLESLAAITLVSVLVRELVRAAVAHRICPEIGIGPRLATWAEVRHLVGFGSKLSAIGLISLTFYQVNAMMVVGYVGIAALAVYSRPLAIVRHLSALAGKLGMVMVPTAGSFTGREHRTSAADLAIAGTRYSAYLLVPPLLVVGVMGDAVLHLWMGERYDHGTVLAILVLGHAFHVTQPALMSVLIGMNRHGPVAWIVLAGGLLGVVVSMVSIGLWGWQLHGAAAAISTSIVAGSVACAIYGCRVLETPLASFVKRAYGGPAAACTVLMAVLLTVRAVTPDSTTIRLIAGGVAGVIVMAPVYWIYVLPASMRDRVRVRVWAMTRRQEPDAHFGAVLQGIESTVGAAGPTLSQDPGPDHRGAR